jgi:hypothetical protein
MKYQVFSTSWFFGSEEVHVHDDVAGEELPLGGGLFPTANLGNHFGGNQHLVDIVTHLLRLALAENPLANPSLLSGKDMNDVPLVLWRRGGHDGDGKMTCRKAADFSVRRT